MSVPHAELVTHVEGLFSEDGYRVVNLEHIIPDLLLVDKGQITAVEICRSRTNEIRKIERFPVYKGAGYDSVRIISTFRRADFDKTYDLSEVNGRSKIDIKLDFNDDETKWGYLAGVLDMGASFRVSLGRTQFMPYIHIYSQDRDRLVALVNLGWPFTKVMPQSKGTFAMQINGYKRLRDLLEPTIPHMYINKEAAEVMLALTNSRLKHPSSKYTIGEHQLMRKLTILTSRPSAVGRRLEILERWK